jgi:hypothetical protein
MKKLLIRLFAGKEPPAIVVGRGYTPQQLDAIREYYETISQLDKGLAIVGWISVGICVTLLVQWSAYDLDMAMQGQPWWVRLAEVLK